MGCLELLYIIEYNQEVEFQTFSLAWFGFVFFPLFAT